MIREIELTGDEVLVVKTVEMKSPIILTTKTLLDIINTEMKRQEMRDKEIKIWNGIADAQKGVM